MATRKVALVVLVLVVGLVALGQQPAFAVDGVILITQNSVMAAGGFPFTIRNAGSYRLAGNLTVPANKDGLIVAHDDVTIDLNGFTISAAAAIPFADEAGIRESGSRSRIAIRNGSIIGFSPSIDLRSSVRTVVERMLLNAEVPGILGSTLFVGSRTIIRNNIAMGAMQIKCPSIVVENIGTNIVFDLTTGEPSCHDFLNFRNQ